MIRTLAEHIGLLAIIAASSVLPVNAEIYELDVTISKKVYPGSQHLQDHIQRKTALKNQVTDPERVERFNTEIVNASIANNLGHELEYDVTITAEVIDGQITRYSVKGMHPIPDLTKTPNGQVNINYDTYKHLIWDGEFIYMKKIAHARNKEIEYKFKGEHQLTVDGKFYLNLIKQLRIALAESTTTEPIQHTPLTYALQANGAHTAGGFLEITNRNRSIRQYHRQEDGRISSFIDFEFDTPVNEAAFANKVHSSFNSGETTFIVNSIKQGIEADLLIPENIPVEK